MPLAGSLESLLRGLLAGLIAGLLTGAVAFALGEPHVAAAIAIEESAPAADAAGSHEHAAGTAAHSHDDDALVSRDGQRAGLFLATALAGIAIGAIFGVVAHYARRFTTLPGPLLAIGLAGAGWLAVEAVPFFKYPANPPAVGDPDTINHRTWLWLAALALGLLAVCSAVFIAKALVSQRYWTVRVGASVLTFLVIVTVGYLLLPAVNEVGEDFPAALLWEFRISSLATQATLWLCLGLAFAFLAERAQRTPRSGPIASGVVHTRAATRTTRP